MSLAPSEAASRPPFQAGSGLSVRVTCREKGGSQTMFSEYIAYRAVMELQNTFLGECFSNLSGTEVGMMEFVVDHFILIFSREPSGIRVDSVRLISETSHIPAFFSKSLEVAIDSAKGNIYLFANLLWGFLMLQDRTDQFIPLNCIHSVTSQYPGVDTYASDIAFVLTWAEIIAVKPPNGNAHFLI